MRSLTHKERREQNLTPGKLCPRLAFGVKALYSEIRTESTSDQAQIVRFRHGHFELSPTGKSNCRLTLLLYPRRREARASHNAGIRSAARFNQSHWASVSRIETPSTHDASSAWL
jgi:hypothetical protein